MTGYNRYNSHKQKLFDILKDLFTYIKCILKFIYFEIQLMCNIMLVSRNQLIWHVHTIWNDHCSKSFPSQSYTITDHTLSLLLVYSVHLSSVAQSCPTLCNPMNHSTPGLPVHPRSSLRLMPIELVMPSSHLNPLLSPSSPAHNPSQHQSLFQWVNSLHEVAKVLEFQL